ncbi:MAG: hypothetical protein PUJ69_01790, partial [Porphyromonas somerae]|uniref:hypothetical protein n=1 Tax=Porphyromonas somerae TaxID=322095 RepID=UPI0026E9B162
MNNWSPLEEDLQTTDIQRYIMAFTEMQLSDRLVASKLLRNSPKTGVLWWFIIVVIFAVGSCSRIRWLRFMFNLNESNCFFLFISG